MQSFSIVCLIREVMFVSSCLRMIKVLIRYSRFSIFLFLFDFTAQTKCILPERWGEGGGGGRRNEKESLFRHVCLFLQELAAKDAEVLSQEEQEKPVPPEKINEDERGVGRGEMRKRVYLGMFVCFSRRLLPRMQRCYLRRSRRNQSLLRRLTKMREGWGGGKWEREFI